MLLSVSSNFFRGLIKKGFLKGCGSVRVSCSKVFEGESLISWVNEEGKVIAEAICKSDYSYYSNYSAINLDSIRASWINPSYFREVFNNGKV